MKILLYQGFKKRYNSTKVPTDITPVEKDVAIKANFGFENQNQSTKCSIEHPSFFLADAQLYSYLKAWGMYYFIDSIEYDIDGAQYITCSLDVLATWKDRILEHTAFVAFSSTSYSPFLIDQRVPALAEKRMYQVTEVTPISDNDTMNFTWVVGAGGVQIFGVHPSTIAMDLYTASDQDWWDNLCETWADAQSCLLYAKQYPVSGSGGFHPSSSGTAEVMVGRYNTHRQVGVYASSEMYGYHSTSITIPGSYTDFRRYAFSTMKIYLPFIGVVNLSMSDFVDDPTQTAKVHVEMCASFIGGTITYKLSNDDGCVIGKYSGAFGRTLPVSVYSAYNGSGVITSLGGALGATALAAAASNPITLTAGITGAIAGIAGAVNASEESTASSGGSCDGSFDEYLGTDIVLTVEESVSRIEPSNLTDLAGRPCNQVMSLANLTGYVQTAGFSADIEALSSVRESINSLMDNGVYIE